VAEPTSWCASQSAAGTSSHHDNAAARATTAIPAAVTPKAQPCLSRGAVHRHLDLPSRTYALVALSTNSSGSERLDCLRFAMGKR
jgi:hypothetical protein